MVLIEYSHIFCTYTCLFPIVIAIHAYCTYFLNCWLSPLVILQCPLRGGSFGDPGFSNEQTILPVSQKVVHEMSEEKNCACLKIQEEYFQVVFEDIGTLMICLFRNSFVTIVFFFVVSEFNISQVIASSIDIELTELSSQSIG